MLHTEKICTCFGEEAVLSVLTYGVGIALSIAGVAILVCLSCFYGDVWRIILSVM